jgi:hypothetical protein
VPEVVVAEPVGQTVHAHPGVTERALKLPRAELPTARFQAARARYLAAKARTA